MSVHPRVCGKRARMSRRPSMSNGSSPRVRETQPRHFDDLGRARFIPACAGNAGNRLWKRRGVPVHPRVCGKRLEVADMWAAPDGSSPRVRETHPDRAVFAGRRRFIPACAGNAARPRNPRHHWAVHPRVCGKRVRGMVGPHDSVGSSPRVRETRIPVWGVHPLRRFIPACAGNARKTSISTGGIPVHPRVCGKRSSRPRYTACASGSSPRVRETPVKEHPGIGS